MIENVVNEKIFYLLEDIDNKELKKAFKIINEKYRDKNIDDKQLELKEDYLALSYAIYRLPATACVIDEVFSRVSSIEKESFNCKSVIDIGAGPAASLIPLINNFDEIKNVTLIEEQQSMINVGKKLISKLNLDFEVNYLRKSIFNVNEKLKADILLSSYMVNELNEDEIKVFFNKVKTINFKYAIFIVPGTPHHFKKLQTLRKEFLNVIEKYQEINSECSGVNKYKIIAPCTFSGICHLEGIHDWCHFKRRIQRSKILKDIKNGELSYEDEKFSYLVIKNCLLEDNEDKYVDESIESNAEYKKKNRIIRHPIIKKSLIEFKVCNSNSIDSIILTKGKNKDIYKEAKDLKWGDCIEF